MRTNTLATSFLVLAIASSAQAQEHHHRGAATDAPVPTPYAGMQQRAIKSLSDQEITDLRAGRGMGLALAAELNGYPGPSHVLDLANQLGLSPDQRSRTAAAFAAMKDETTVIGQQVIAGETELDRLFSGRNVTPENLDAAVMRIATAQGQLRAAHLRYHLQITSILTPEQVTGMSQSLLNFGGRRWRVEGYAALEAGATGFSAKCS